MWGKKRKSTVSLALTAILQFLLCADSSYGLPHPTIHSLATFANTNTFLYTKNFGLSNNRFFKTIQPIQPTYLQTVSIPYEQSNIVSAAQPAPHFTSGLIPTGKQTSGIITQIPTRNLVPPFRNALDALSSFPKIQINVNSDSVSGGNSSSNSNLFERLTATTQQASNPELLQSFFQGSGRVNPFSDDIGNTPTLRGEIPSFITTQANNVGKFSHNRIENDPEVLRLIKKILANQQTEIVVNDGDLHLTNVPSQIEGSHKADDKPVTEIMHNTDQSDKIDNSEMKSRQDSIIEQDGKEDTLEMKSRQDTGVEHPMTFFSSPALGNHQKPLFENIQQQLPLTQNTGPDTDNRYTIAYQRQQFIPQTPQLPPTQQQNSPFLQGFQGSIRNTSPNAPSPGGPPQFQNPQFNANSFFVPRNNRFTVNPGQQHGQPQQNQQQFPQQNQQQFPQQNQQQFPPPPFLQYPRNTLQGGLAGAPSPGPDPQEPENGYNPYHLFDNENYPEPPYESEFANEPRLNVEELSQEARQRSVETSLTSSETGQESSPMDFAQSTLRNIRTEELLGVTQRKPVPPECAYNTISYGLNGEDCVERTKRGTRETRTN